MHLKALCNPLQWMQRIPKKTCLPARQALLIMKMTAILLFVACMQVSASGFGQGITLSEKNVPLEKVFGEIKKQTGYTFAYTESQLNKAKTVSINVRNGTLEQVLAICFKGQPFTYAVIEKTIVIQPKPEYLDELSVTETPPPIDVRGRVVNENGDPVAGATIMVKGTNRGTNTNADGYFEMKNVDENATLVISAVNIITYEVRVNGRSDLAVIGVRMKITAEEELIINAGYYDIKDRERTGNISKVTAKEIEKQPINNPLMALVGKVAGLEITQSTGVPGGGFTVRIRGQNSIGSGNDPMYIIDGVNYPSTGISSTSSGGINNILGTGGANPLGLINPNDIESIEVLKDADATAIYGSRGANGVILITTKKGKTGPTKINVSISQGFSQVGHKIDLLNTQEYLQMREEAYFINDKFSTTHFDYPTLYDINGTWDRNKYTDWQDKLIGGTAPLTQASLTLTGGNAKSNYLIGATYSSEGVVVPGNFGVERAGIRSNINLGSPEDRFNASLTANLSHHSSDLFSGGLTSYIFLPPNQPDSYDEFGQLNWANNTVISNPYANLLNTTNTTTGNLLTNLALSFKISKDLIFKASLGYNTIHRKEFRKVTLASWAPAYGFGSAFRSGYFGNNFNNNLSFEPQLTYERKMGFGKMQALIGSSYQHNTANLNVVQGRNFTSDELIGNIGSAAILSNDQNQFVNYRYFAVFARLNYSLQDKYFMNITARRDGSSRFGPDKQFANFGAVGAGWIFSDEKFIKDRFSFLNFGKLRGSYGITGNDQILDYQYLQLWNSSPNYQGNSTLMPSPFAKNSTFSWETNRKLELALQLGLFKDLINLEVSWFRNRSSDQLIFQNFPSSTGQYGVYLNLPAEIQNKGWEFDSDFKILNRKHLTWSAGLTLTIPKNTLLSYPGLEATGNAMIYEIGKPLNILKTANITVDPLNGSYVIEDKNGNGFVDDPDRYLTKFLGQIYYGGFQNTLKYKQFGLDILLSFAKQNGRSYLTNTMSPGSYSWGSASNQFTEVLNRWKQQGDQTEIPLYSTTFENDMKFWNVQMFGNNSVIDASYIRLRNISLSYSLPQKALSALKISNALFTVQGQNLYTLTDYVGFDPETQGLNLPPLRTIVLGLNLTF